MITYKSSLEKPQLAFTDGVDNSAAPFQPKLKVKHNAQMPWSPSGRLSPLFSSADSAEGGLYENPYLYEINSTHGRFLSRRPFLPVVGEGDAGAGEAARGSGDAAGGGGQRDGHAGAGEGPEEPAQHRSGSRAPQLPQLPGLHLSDPGSVVAPSPPQISTRETDYLVDVLKARDSVWLLNEVFTDPAIMKVLHGADMDVVWLQKDFGVYLVGERASSHAGEHVRHGPGGARARFRVVRPRVPAEALLRREGEQGVPAGRLEVGLVSLSPAESAR